MASYGIEAVWPYLTTADLHHLETAKTRFLKKSLSLSKFTKSRYVYELADTGLFVEDLRLKFNLPETESYNKFLTNKSYSSTDIDDKFYDTPQWSTQTGKNLVLKIDICSPDTPAMAFIMCCAVRKATTRVPVKHASVTSATSKWISTTSSTAPKIICRLSKPRSWDTEIVHMLFTLCKSFFYNMSVVRRWRLIKYIYIIYLLKQKYPICGTKIFASMTIYVS